MNNYFVFMTIFCIASVGIYYWYLKYEKKTTDIEDKMIVWITKIYLIVIFVIHNFIYQVDK